MVGLWFGRLLRRVVGRLVSCLTGGSGQEGLGGLTQLDGKFHLHCAAEGPTILASGEQRGKQAI